MKSWQRYAGVFFLAVSAVVIQQSVWVLRLLDHGQPGSGLMPFSLGVILAALSLWLIAANLGRDEQRIPFWQPRAWLRPLVAVGITVAYAVVFDDVGAITSVTVLVACWLFFVERKGLAVSLLTGALTGLAVWLLFDRFLQTPFPKGVLI
jgi:hypothetical protein